MSFLVKIVITAFSSVTYYSQCRPISCLAEISLNCRPNVKSEKAVPFEMNSMYSLAELFVLIGITLLGFSSSHPCFTASETVNLKLQQPTPDQPLHQGDFGFVRKWLG
jgi:hypothetical protein